MSDLEFLSRLSRQHRPGMWIGGIRRAFGPLIDVDDASGAAVLDTHPPHYLTALWEPLRHDQPLLPRWPVKASLVAPDARSAVASLLRDVPRGQRLWLSDHAFDWLLVADIVMLSEPGLRPWQFRGLREFIEAQRQANLSAISVNYGGSDEVFDQFRRTDPGTLAG